MNIAELFALAILIKNETGVDKNTATRIGTLFNEILEKISEGGGGGGEGSGVQVITIANMEELDFLPQGVYLINGIAEGLLVVAHTPEPEAPRFNVEFSGYVCAKSSGINTGYKRATAVTIIDTDTMKQLNTNFSYNILPYLTNNQIAALSDVEYEARLAALVEQWKAPSFDNPEYVPPWTLADWDGETLPTANAQLLDETLCPL